MSKRVSLRSLIISTSVKNLSTASFTAPARTSLGVSNSGFSCGHSLMALSGITGAPALISGCSEWIATAASSGSQVFLCSQLFSDDTEKKIPDRNALRAVRAHLQKDRDAAPCPQPRAVDLNLREHGFYRDGRPPLDERRPAAPGQPRDQRLRLDSPPPVSAGTQPLAPDPADRDRVRTGYYDGGYETIYPGSRVYYTDLALSQPLGPLLIPAYSVPTLLVDPMGSHKPYYLRVPVYKDNSFLFDYSSDRDQCEFREDLSARQRQIQQKRRFGAFQLHNDPERYYPAYDRADYGRLPLFRSS